MTMVETDEVSHERILELRDLQTSYGSILKNTLWTAQNGLYSIGLTNERSFPFSAMIIIWAIVVAVWGTATTLLGGMWQRALVGREYSTMPCPRTTTVLHIASNPHVNVA